MGGAESLKRRFVAKSGRKGNDMNLVKFGNIVVNSEYVASIAEHKGSTLIFTIGSEEPYVVAEPLETIVEKLETKQWHIHNPIPKWIEALAEKTDATDADILKNALLQIREINSIRPHDGYGYEVNDIIEAALAYEKMDKKGE